MYIDIADGCPSSNIPLLLCCALLQTTQLRLVCNDTLHHQVWNQVLVLKSFASNRGNAMVMQPSLNCRFLVGMTISSNHRMCHHTLQCTGKCENYFAA